MPNNNLADLTEGELLEYVAANPSVLHKIRSSDPRVKLLERLYGDPAAKKAIQKEVKRLHPNAEVPDLDIAADVRKELEPDLTAIKELRTTLETRDKGERRKAFVASIVDAGAALDIEVKGEDVAKIEQFMLDNEIGPKSIDLAVSRYYETTAPVEPTGTQHSFELPQDDQMKALIGAPPGADLDAINMPFAEQIFNDMTGGKSRRRSPVLA